MSIALPFPDAPSSLSARWRLAARLRLLRRIRRRRRIAISVAYLDDRTLADIGLPPRSRPFWQIELLPH